MNTSQTALEVMRGLFDRNKQLSENLFVVSIGNLSGIYSIAQGKLVLSLDYVDIERSRKRDLLKIKNLFHHYGYFSLSQERIVVPIQFERIDFLDENSGLVDDDKFVIFDTEFKAFGLFSITTQSIVLPTKYQEIKLLPGDRILVRKNYKFGVLSLIDFEELLPLINDKFGPRIDCDLVVVNRNGAVGVYCLMEKCFVISLSYKEITLEKETLIITGFDKTKTTVQVVEARIAKI
ncbi:MAG: hypothetical protein WCF94_03965 [bacterium]